MITTPPSKRYTLDAVHSATPSNIVRSLSTKEVNSSSSPMSLRFPLLHRCRISTLNSRKFAQPRGSVDRRKSRSVQEDDSQRLVQASHAGGFAGQRCLFDEFCLSPQ